MNPNQPLPQNPNAYTGPAGGEPIPDANLPWDTEMDDRNSLDAVLREARAIELDTVSAQARTDQYNETEALRDRARATHNVALEAKWQGVMDQLDSARAQGNRDRQYRADQNNANFDTLVDNSNPTSLLNVLRGERAAADESDANAARTAGYAHADATTAGNAGRNALVDYTSTTRHTAAIPLPTHPDRTIERQLQRAELDRRRLLMREVNHGTSSATVGARGARTAAERSQRHYDEQEWYPDAVQQLADRLQQRHEANWQAAEAANYQITSELRTWGIQQGPDPGGEARVRAMLESYRGAIDNLPRVDSARAEALANYTRLRYRLESRSLLDDTLAGQVNPDREFTGNRGILLRDQSGNEVIIHDDGSVERDEGGVFVRRDASGQVSMPLRTEIVIDPDAPVDPVDVAFARWEETRTPEAAAAAHASLGEFVREQGAQEMGHTDAINTLDQRITATDQVIANAPAELSTAQTELARLQAAVADPTAPTKQERKAIDAQTEQVAAIQKSLADARRDRPQWITMRTTEVQARRQVREQLNPALFWHGYLEVNSNRSVAEAQGTRFGRIFARRAAQRETDALPAEPILHHDGTLSFDSATINGVHADNWYLRSDGEATRRDATGRWIRYRPNGTVRP